MFIGLFLNPGIAFCQFQGGNADGCSSSVPEIITLNDQDLYCRGGSADGGSFFSPGLITLNLQNAYCQGGSFDGYSASGSLFISLNEQSFYCSGGDADGTTLSAFSGYYASPAIHCSGGNGDGYNDFTYNGYLMPMLFCRGGTGDGYQSDTSDMQWLGYGIWTGAISTLWDAAANWKYNTLPTVSSSVLIPSGAAFYPDLSDTLAINHSKGIYQCKRLDILSGGQLTVRDHLIVEGIMNVNGTLNFMKINDNSFSILPGGSLTVRNGGEVKLE